MPGLLTKLEGRTGDEDEADVAVSRLVSLPYATATGYCIPAKVLCCFPPCERSEGQAVAVRASLVQQGLFKAAIAAIGNGGSIAGSGLQVLEQFVPFFPAAAIAAGTIPAVQGMAGMYKLDAKPGEAIDPIATSGKAGICTLIACVLAVLAASSASGLDAATRLALAQEASGLVSPYQTLIPQFSHWPSENQAALAARVYAIMLICNAVISTNGSPAPLTFTRPKDLELKVPCGPTHKVSVFTTGNTDTTDGDIAGVYLSKPPVRPALAAFQTVVPMMQNMA